MTGEEIIEEMNKYTQIIQDEKSKAFDRMCNQEPPDVIDEAKDNIHKAAIECLNKILTPELKVFVRNLCYNTLGYPEEPIFYKAFGDYPEEGDKVSLEELKEKGVDISKLEGYKDEIWFYEGNWIEKEEIDGKEYYVIKGLCPNAEDMEEKRNANKLIYLLKKNLNQIKDKKTVKQIQEIANKIDFAKFDI